MCPPPSSARSAQVSTISAAPRFAPISPASGMRRNTRGWSGHDAHPRRQWRVTTPSSQSPLRVGIGVPVGSGKTALMDLLCKNMRERYDIAAITNDIYTKWDSEFLVRSGSLTPDRIAGVETGGCPHTAIREDASMNLAAVADMRAKFPDLDLVLIESGGDNLAATFSPELAGLTIYVT